MSSTDLQGQQKKVAGTKKMSAKLTREVSQV